jgi:23S rRNA pseudouridine1911/1915/1917 synthase
MDKLKVLFEDDQILVIDKNAGIVVTPADTIQTETISDILINDFKINLDRGGVVHRLDKDTSGVLIVAKTQKALENLQAQFKERIVKKQYITLVHGNLTSEQTVKGAIARNPGNREKFIVLEDDDSKTAETKFVPAKHLELSKECLPEIFPDFSKIQYRKLSTVYYSLLTLLNCFPLTGRTHQIRVHLKHIGFPIVSDEKYGGRKTVRLDRRWCPRQFLHAFKLELNHPETGKRMEFISELPEDLSNALTKLTVM